MKQILFTLSFAILSLAVVGCKTGNDVTPIATTNITGSYRTSVITHFKLGTNLVTESTMGTLTIKAGDKPNTFRFEEQYPTAYVGYNPNVSYNVTLSGNGFQLESMLDKVPSGGIFYTGQQKGFGNVSDYGLVIYKSLETAESNKLSSMVIEKNTEVRAYKQ